MKFHSSQNLAKNAKLTPISAIRAKFSTSPSPSLGIKLKLAFRFPKSAYRKSIENNPITASTK